MVNMICYMIVNYVKSLIENVIWSYCMYQSDPHLKRSLFIKSNFIFKFINVKRILLRLLCTEIKRWFWCVWMGLLFFLHDASSILSGLFLQLHFYNFHSLVWAFCVVQSRCLALVVIRLVFLLIPPVTILSVFPSVSQGERSGVEVKRTVNVDNICLG